MCEYECLRTTFWDETYEVLYKTYYYEEYAKCLYRISIAVQYSCIFASTISLFLLFQFNGQYGLLLSLVAIAGQIILAFRPTFQYEKRLIALKYLIEDLNTLHCEMKGKLHIYDAIDYADLTIATSLSEYISEYGRLETRYIGFYEPLFKEKIRRKADKRYSERKKYIESKPNKQN